MDQKDYADFDAQEDAQESSSQPPTPHSTPLQPQEPPAQELEQEREREALVALFAQIDALKEEAQAEYKKGMYEGAVAVYERAAQLAAEQRDAFRHFKRDLVQKEASLFSNMAACYKQGQHTKKEIEFCTKVIERAPFLSDLGMLAKAYQRRAYAFEHAEKLAEAKQDMLSVRELQPRNQEATKALERLNKALREAQQADVSDAELRLGKLKEAGNALFQARAFREAAAKFSEGVALFMKDREALLRDRDVRLKVTQIFTNRALAYH